MFSPGGCVATGAGAPGLVSQLNPQDATYQGHIESSRETNSGCTLLLTSSHVVVQLSYQDLRMKIVFVWVRVCVAGLEVLGPSVFRIL